MTGIRRITAGFAMLGLALCGRASAQFTERVSLSSSGAQGNLASVVPSISADGNLVAFESWSSDLVAGDSNQRADVFVRDRGSRTTSRVSVGAGGAQGNDDSTSAAISADGRFVAFASSASNLVPGDTNGALDVFVRDRQSGTTSRVSIASTGVQGNADSAHPSISADGRYVAFWSRASNLVPGDGNGCADVFVHDRQLRITVRASVDSSGAEGDQDSLSCSISADGRHVAFESYATNLVRGDTNASEDVFVRDLSTGRTVRISVDSAGAQANGDSGSPAISADGRKVAFHSLASNLVAGDTNAALDVFLRALPQGVTTRASVATGGIQANDFSFAPSISADGRCVAFVSFASNLVSGDSSGSPVINAYLRDVDAGSTIRVNVGPAGAADDAGTNTVSIAADGRNVAFDSRGRTLVPGDTNDVSDVFVRDRFGGTHFTSICEPGSAGVIACPCGNPPSGPRRGCDNSSSTGGASLTASGGSFLSEDTLVLAAAGLKEHATSVLLQGTVGLASGLPYGQGVRCAAGTVKRLFKRSASGGSTAFPDLAAGEPTISARTAALGVPILPGQSRWYAVLYRDPIVLGGCAADRTLNLTQTGRVAWGL